LNSNEDATFQFSIVTGELSLSQFGLDKRKIYMYYAFICQKYRVPFLFKILLIIYTHMRSVV